MVRSRLWRKELIPRDEHLMMCATRWGTHSGTEMSRVVRGRSDQVFSEDERTFFSFFRPMC